MSGKNLQGANFFYSGEFKCSEEVRSAEWRNDGGAIYIKSLSIGAGLIFNQTADMSVVVTRISDWSRLAGVGWDRYAHGAQPIIEQWRYAPDHFEIAPGDGLHISYRSYGFSVDKKGKGKPRDDYTALFWVDGTYTLEP